MIRSIRNAEMSAGLLTPIDPDEEGRVSVDVSFGFSDENNADTTADIVRAMADFGVLVEKCEVFSITRVQRIEQLEPRAVVYHIRCHGREVAPEDVDGLPGELLETLLSTEFSLLPDAELTQASNFEEYMRRVQSARQAV